MHYKFYIEVLRRVILMNYVTEVTKQNEEKTFCLKET